MNDGERSAVENRLPSRIPAIPRPAPCKFLLVTLSQAGGSRPQPSAQGQHRKWGRRNKPSDPAAAGDRAAPGLQEVCELDASLRGAGPDCATLNRGRRDVAHAHSREGAARNLRALRTDCQKVLNRESLPVFRNEVFLRLAAYFFLFNREKGSEVQHFSLANGPCWFWLCSPCDIRKYFGI